MDRPFSSSSPWNTPIGTGAQFQSRTDTETAAVEHGPGTVTWVYDNAVTIYQAKSTDPLATWSYTSHEPNATWQYGPSGSGSFQTQTPSDLQLVSEGNTILKSVDGLHFIETWGGSKASDGSYHAAYIVENSLDGSGISLPGEHDGTRSGGTSLLAGLITQQDLNTLNIDHAVALELPYTMLKASSDPSQQYVWPAHSADSGGASVYSGTVPMGSLFAIPKDVDLSKAGISTPEGMALAKAYQTYGGYVSDTTDAKSVNLASLESGVSQQQVDNLRTDMGAIRNLVQLVTNNSETSVGGGSATSTGDGNAATASGLSESTTATTSAPSSIGGVSTTATSANASSAAPSSSANSSADNSSASTPIETRADGSTSGTAGTAEGTTNSASIARPAVAGSTTAAQPPAANSTSTSVTGSAASDQPAVANSQTSQVTVSTTGTDSATPAVGMANTSRTASSSTSGSSSASGTASENGGSTVSANPVNDQTASLEQPSIASIRPVTDSTHGAPAGPSGIGARENAADPAIITGTTNPESTVTTGGTASSAPSAVPVASNPAPENGGVSAATNVQPAPAFGPSGSANSSLATTNSHNQSTDAASAFGQSPAGVPNPISSKAALGSQDAPNTTISTTASTNSPQREISSNSSRIANESSNINNPSIQTFRASDKEKEAAMAIAKKVVRYETHHPSPPGWANRIFDMLHQYW
ncbi:hypothetical protein MKK63_05575 [Methylobacterium sp. J-088]|uniref:hypothetical protein n=1 Tax=Methylobacterium sp. J-088 TaxID=2836664 RepID=UPI001FB86A4D|nr:hypothetical protein [Methylobacterium sp. J-088]MCJ2062171.1 hypothetical protein [Methylobacterium sp. J-088]